MPPIVSTDWRRCIFPPNQLFLYFTTTKVIEKASNYKVLFNNVYRLAAAPLNCCKLRATRLASEIFSAASSTYQLINLKPPYILARLNYAAIDIGSNAVRLLIKSIDSKADDKSKFKKIMLLRVPLRLGFDIFANGELSDKKADKLRRLMKAYRQLMKIYDVDDYRACATSAMRDAVNGPEVIAHILKETGLNIEIIDGKEEAHIVYSNHLECMADRTGNYIYVDVGGGSTEVNHLCNGQLLNSASYNIGTVRLLTGNVRDDEWLRLEHDLDMMMQNGTDHINIIGSGGNINKIYRMTAVKDRALQRMPIYSVQAIYDELKPLSVEERMEQFALKNDRADVIIPAAEIFLRIARTVHAEYIHVPVIGLADGIIDELYAQRLTRQPQKV